MKESIPASRGRSWQRVLLMGWGLIITALILAPWPLMDKLFAIAYGICPQRASHSYIIAGQQLPLEARMTGIFSGFLLTYLSILVRGRGKAAAFPPPLPLGLCMGFIGLMGIDGINNTLADLHLPHLYTPDLRLRLGTGLLSGIGMAGLVIPALNFVLWRDGQERPVLSTIADLAGLLALASLFFLLVTSTSPFLLYPIAIFSISGLIALLTCINMVIIMGMAGKDWQVATWGETLPILSLAFIMTVGELGFLSVVRYTVLGAVPLE